MSLLALSNGLEDDAVPLTLALSPRRGNHTWCTLESGLLGELVEEGVFAVVGGPDGQIVGPGDAALGGLPEEFGIGVFGEFVEADVAAINSHGVWIGGEGDDARAVVEFDVADFDFFGEGRTCCRRVEAIDFEVVFAVGDDGAGEIEEVGEFVATAHVFERAGIVFGDEKVVAICEAKAFANVFEAIAEGPADADGFFGEGEDLFLASWKGSSA